MDVAASVQGSQQRLMPQLTQMFDLALAASSDPQQFDLPIAKLSINAANKDTFSCFRHTTTHTNVSG